MTSRPTTDKFWETKTLDDMSPTEWEALCDGCGRCCLNKLEDEETGEVHFTSVACRLLNIETCKCSSYDNRFAKVPDCLAVQPLTAQKSQWLPPTCAYRRLAEGTSLPEWHPLISGDVESVHRAGIGMVGRCQSESNIPVTEYPLFLISLID